MDPGIERRRRELTRQADEHRREYHELMLGISSYVLIDEVLFYARAEPAFVLMSIPIFFIFGVPLVVLRQNIKEIAVETMLVKLLQEGSYKT